MEAPSFWTGLYFLGAEIFIILFYGFFIILYTAISIIIFNKESEKIAEFPANKTYIERWKTVLPSYILLSIFVFPPIYLALVFYKIELDLALIISQVGTVEFIIIMRLMLNPTKGRPSLFTSDINNLSMDQIKNLKERFLSLFFSFIAISWFIIILFFVSVSLSISFHLPIGNNMAFIPKDLNDPSTAGFILLLLIGSYLISIAIISLLVEYYLQKTIPIHQTDC